MKKLAIGCLVVVVLCGAAFVGISYWGYMKVKGAVTQLAELSKIPEIEQGVRVKSPYVIPASGTLTQAQVDRFIKVTTAVQARLGQNMAVFRRNYQSLAQKKETTAMDLPQLMGAYRDLAAAWLDAKKAQVEALNNAGLSLDEYRWIRSTAYQAIDVPFMDVDFARIARQAKEDALQGSILIGGAFTGKAPAGNRALVEKYRKQLEDYLPLAGFGL
jgi:hypothetical protein